jgi:hypothetical protein
VSQGSVFTLYTRALRVGTGKSGVEGTQIYGPFDAKRKKSCAPMFSVAKGDDIYDVKKAWLWPRQFQGPSRTNAQNRVTFMSSKVTGRQEICFLHS